MRAAADEALRTVGLADKAGQDYLTLSGGEKQLCILARTIAEDAPLLLLDEPDSALDLANRSRMTALLAQLVHTGGKTALVCLHDPALALDSCDILVVLQGGGVAAVLHPQNRPACRAAGSPCRRVRPAGAAARYRLPGPTPSGPAAAVR